MIFWFEETVSQPGAPDMHLEVLHVMVIIIFQTKILKKADWFGSAGGYEG